MKVKRFEASDTKSALALVKEQLGHDAVILSTKTLAPEGGRPRRVEVVAAVDFEVETVDTTFTERTRQKTEAPAFEPETTTSGTYRRPGLARINPTAPQFNPAAAPRSSSHPAAVDHLLQEAPETGINLSREARLLQQRFAGVNGARQGSDTLSISQPPTKEGGTPKNGTRSGRGKNSPDSDSRGRPSPEEVAQWRNKILEQLAVRPLNLEGVGGPMIIALVGPTGVGKTTTAAKIAAWFSLHENARVALLSMDCYRIGATDQLRTYARIMRLPCEIALREQDLASALHKHRNQDLIIIDTAGKSPFDDSHIPELSRWFSSHADITPYLVLSATAKKEDINHIIATYRPLGVPAAILTKLDETRAYAALCQQMTRAELPIACLCTGQKVPEDFLPASKEFLKTLFGQGWDEAMNQQALNTARDGWLG